MAGAIKRCKVWTRFFAIADGSIDLFSGRPQPNCCLFWYACRSGNSGLHYDRYDNVHFLLNGEKVRTSSRHDFFCVRAPVDPRESIQHAVGLENIFSLGRKQHVRTDSCVVQLQLVLSFSPCMHTFLTHVTLCVGTTCCRCGRWMLSETFSMWIAAKSWNPCCPGPRSSSVLTLKSRTGTRSRIPPSWLPYPAQVRAWHCSHQAFREQFRDKLPACDVLSLQEKLLTAASHCALVKHCSYQPDGLTRCDALRALLFVRLLGPFTSSFVVQVTSRGRYASVTYWLNAPSSSLGETQSRSL